MCLLTYKAINSGEPEYLFDLLKRYEPVTTMNLRSLDENRLNEPVIRHCTTVERCFEHAAPRLFNNLPFEIRQKNSLTSFKKSLKTYLFTKAYDMNTETINDDFKV